MRPGRAIFQQAGRDDHFLDHLVRGQHGEHGIGLKSIGRSGNRLRAFAAQFLDRRLRPVPDQNAMTRRDQPRRHGRAHAAQSDKPNIHGQLPS